MVLDHPYIVIALCLAIALVAPWFIPVRKMQRDDSGSVAIEFAICVPVLILLALGSVDVIQLAQARSAAATLATGICQVASRAGWQPSGGFDITAGHDAAVNAFMASVPTAFLFPGTTSATANIDEFPDTSIAGPTVWILKCSVRVTVNPLVGYLGSTPRVFTQMVVD